MPGGTWGNQSPEGVSGALRGAESTDVRPCRSWSEAVCGGTSRDTGMRAHWQVGDYKCCWSIEAGSRLSDLGLFQHLASASCHTLHIAC